MFQKFCTHLGISALPASDNTLLLFITHLHQRNLSLGTVKVYMSAIITLHNMLGLVPPNSKNPKIRLALRAIKNSSPAPGQKSPITFNLLLSIWQVIDRLPDNYCIKAALSLGFFGGLRGAEYLLTQFSSGPKLSQISFSKCTKFMYYKVKKSKTKPHGFTISLACSHHTICAVCCMTQYLQLRHCSSVPKDTDPLLVWKGSELSKQTLNVVIKDLVASIGLVPTNYSIHSLRSGVATTAALNNFKEWEIKKLGGWASNTYLTYIRHSTRHTTHFARRLAHNK